MNINLKDNIKVVTNYNFKKYRNDVLLQEENTHNVLCNTFFTSAVYMNEAKLYVGNGSGIPAATDSALFNKLWDITADSSKMSYHLKNDEDPSEWCQVLKKFTIQASSSYVGTITECGLYTSVLLTHALLLDAEGNPISIEKTDLDVVIIEITIRFYFNDTAAVKILPANINCFYRALNGAAFKNIACNNIEVLWSLALPLSGKDTYTLSTEPYYFASNVSTSLTITNSKTGNSTRQSLIQGARLGTDFPVTGQHFIRGLRIANTFIIPFPNEDIFPRYEIKDMEVGIGDGITTEFTCPMNYFIEDTDKIYINGILQTRGVDYTLEWDNNNQGCAELMACNDAIITGGIIEKSTTQPYVPIFYAALNAGQFSGASSWGSWSYNGNISNYVTSFTTDKPLFIDMQKEVKINYFQIGNAYIYLNGPYVFTLWASDDGQTYTEVVSITRSTSTVSKIKFDTIVKRYFKVTIKYANNANNTNSGSFCALEQGTKDWKLQAEIPSDKICLLGYIGHGIQFTNPPEDGAIITMDASTDLPMKNSNFVFDINLKLNY